MQMISPFEAVLNQEEVLEESQDEDIIPQEESLMPLPQAPIRKTSCSTATAGNLGRYFCEWSNITSNNFVLNIIQSGYKIQFSNSNFVLPNQITTPSKSKKPIIINEIEKLLISGAVSKVDHSDLHVVSRVFTVHKNSEGYRLNIDLSLLNTYIK